MTKQDIIDKLSKQTNDNIAIDPLTILAITSFVIQIIKLIYECRNNKKVLENCKNRNIIQNVRLRLAIRNAFPKENYSFKNEIYNKLIEIGSNLTQDQFDKIIMESINEK